MVLDDRSRTRVMNHRTQRARDMSLVAAGLLIGLIVVAVAVAINVDHKASIVATRLEQSPRAR